MLQNINILVGGVPRLTGNTREDMQEMAAFIDRLMRALEYSFDLLDAETEKMQKRIEEMQKKLDAQAKEIQKQLESKGAGT